MLGMPFGSAAWPYNETMHEPAHELEVIKGENVCLRESGKVLGKIHDLVYDDDRELAGVVVHPEGFFPHDVLLQMRFLDRSEDDVLFAHISEEDLKHLQPFEPAD